MAKSFEDRLDSFAELWKPEEGDTLVGTIVEIDQRDSDYGHGQYPIITVAREDGLEFAFHAFHSVAKNELARLEPVTGEKIGIKYLGEKTPKGGGKAYKSYRIKIDRTAETGRTIDWSAMKSDSDREMQAAGAERAEAPPAAATRVPTPAPPADDDIPF